MYLLCIGNFRLTALILDISKGYTYSEDKMAFVNFIGAPCSGKTTVAAGIFSRLKKYGMAAEYVSEYARRHIAAGLGKLWDDDQICIMQNQLHEENLFLHNSTVITDSCVANSLLYLKDKNRHDASMYYDKALGRANGIYFYCQQVPIPFIQDPNRIHNQEQISVLEEDCKNLVAKIQKDYPKLKIHTLSEMDVDRRIDTAIGIVLQESIKLC